MADNRWRRRENPYNQDNLLYKRLTRLLSGPIVNLQRQSPRYYRADQYVLPNKLFKSTSGQAFKKQEYDKFYNIQSISLGAARRSERYTDFDQMEFTPEINSALDIYADEMTTSNEFNKLLKINCNNEEIKDILTILFYKVLNVEHNLFGWSRTMCKYGDTFLYLDIEEGLGVKNVIALPVSEIERLEGEDKTNPNYIQFQWNAGGMTLENWQVAHFRILGNDKYTPYGTSVLEPARRIWRQLTLLEDAMMAYRIVRSPERRVFKIDVGGIAPEDVQQFMEKTVTEMKRHKIVDDSTGKVDLRFNPMSIDEDFFIPVRPGSATEITNLPGGQFTGAIDDVEYLRDKLFSALKLPRSYLARGKDAPEDKATLSQKDTRFAKTIQRLQRSIISELEKVAIIHLYTLGYKGNDLVSFSLSLNNPSKLSELQELEHWKSKFEVATAATEGFFSKHWIAKNIFGITDDEYVRNLEEMFTDARFAKELKDVSEGAESATGGGGGGGPLGGLGGLGGGEETPPAEAPEAPETPEAPAPTPEAGGGENVLLAAPEAGAPADKNTGEYDEVAYIRYKDGGYITPGAKGKKYFPVKNDKRETAGFGKHMRSNAAINLASDPTGLRSHKSMARGIMENKVTNYIDEDEKILHELNFEIKVLLDSLESKKDK